MKTKKLFTPFMLFCYIFRDACLVSCQKQNIYVEKHVKSKSAKGMNNFESNRVTKSSQQKKIIYWLC